MPISALIAPTQKNVAGVRRRSNCEAIRSTAVLSSSNC
jgi:hypothetical protein